MSVPPNSFSIMINDMIVPDSDGNGYGTIDPSSLKIPQGFIAGSPPNLQALASLVGPENIMITYTTVPTGYVTGHQCKITYDLIMDLNYQNGTSKPGTIVAKSDISPGDAHTFTSADNVVVDTTSEIAVSASTTRGHIDGGGGQGCGGKSEWDNTRINLRLDVVVNLEDYCTTKNNIYDQDMCYNYLGEYFQSGEETDYMTTYVQDYCVRTMPTGSLDDLNTADKRNTNICACNMPVESYDDFVAEAEKQYTGDFSSMPPQCVYPLCDTSSFQPAALDGCPVPSCLNLVVDSGGNTTGGINTSQSTDCASYKPKSSKTINNDQENTIGGDGSDNGDGGDSQNDSDSNLLLWFIVIVVILLLISLMTGSIFYMNRRKK